MSDFFAATELVYARRSPILGDLVGGFPEHWEIFDANGTVVAVVEERMSMLSRAARFASSTRFGYQQRHRLEVSDSSGRPLFGIVKPSSKMGREHAEVWTAEGTAAGTVRLIRPEGSEFLGLGFYDSRDARLGEARENREKTASSGHRTFDVRAAGGALIGEFASTRTRGGSGPSGYRLRIAETPPVPLRSLVFAAPIVRYFLR